MMLGGTLVLGRVIKPKPVMSPSPNWSKAQAALLQGSFIRLPEWAPGDAIGRDPHSSAGGHFYRRKESSASSELNLVSPMDLLRTDWEVVPAVREYVVKRGERYLINDPFSEYDKPKGWTILQEKGSRYTRWEAEAEVRRVRDCRLVHVKPKKS